MEWKNMNSMHPTFSSMQKQNVLLVIVKEVKVMRTFISLINSAISVNILSSITVLL